MRVHYVCHACLVIETGDITLATDPWFGTPVYSGQWHVFPKPVVHELLDQTEIILISHAHEDHLHEATLRHLAEGRQLIYPYYWYEDTIPYLRSIGFSEVKEATSGRSIRLAAHTRVTFITVGQDSIIVIETPTQVLVNVNDALHSSEPQTIERVTRDLKQRWPKIDTVFCGFGGASYYPNTIHWEGKNDAAIALVREELFAHNFCRIVQVLQPSVAVPFAADFVLLSNGQRWINSERFPREAISSYYDKHFRKAGDAVKIVPMYSGDILEDEKLQKKSPYRHQMIAGRLDHLIEQQYASEINGLRSRSFCTVSDISDTLSKLQSRLDKEAKKHSADLLQTLNFSIKLTDLAGGNYVNVNFDHGIAKVECQPKCREQTQFIIETNSLVLRSLFAHDWAGDVFIIGYGLDIRVLIPSVIADGTLRKAMDLLTAYPNPKKYMLRHPIRSLCYLAKNFRGAVERLTSNITRKLTRNDGYPSLIKGNHWLTDCPEDLRRKCGLPFD